MHYNKANSDLIRRSINEFSWENRFSNTDANQKVNLFNEIIKNILSNFIPHKTIFCDDRDLPWINSKIKNLVAEKNIAKKYYLLNNSNIQLFRRFQSLQNLLTVTTKKSKEQFYSRISNKLMDPATSPKAYWSILKTFLNNKKIPCIPHSDIFNNFFDKQCTIINNTSQLPTDSFKRTNNCLSTISFTKDDIAKITKNLDPNKVYGHDMISIHMLKTCGESILKLLELIFESCIESGKFSIEWKKTNVVPVHEKMANN